MNLHATHKEQMHWLGHENSEIRIIRSIQRIKLLRPLNHHSRFSGPRISLRRGRACSHRSPFGSRHGCVDTHPCQWSNTGSHGSAYDGEPSETSSNPNANGCADTYRYAHGGA